MTVRLVYHPIGSKAKDPAFANTIMEIAKEKELCLACPYLDVDYVKGILGQRQDWRLLTDGDAWLQSMAGVKNKIREFILQNQERVKHYRDLHAKVLIAGRRALIGSANFTNSGIEKNVELSIRLDDCDEVDELRTWFDQHWQQGKIISPVDLNNSVASVRDADPMSSYVPLPWSLPDLTNRLRPPLQPPSIRVESLQPSSVSLQPGSSGMALSLGSPDFLILLTEKISQIQPRNPKPFALWLVEYVLEGEGFQISKSGERGLDFVAQEDTEKRAFMILAQNLGPTSTAGVLINPTKVSELENTAKKFGLTPFIAHVSIVSPSNGHREVDLVMIASSAVPSVFHRAKDNWRLHISKITNSPQVKRMSWTC